MKIILNAPAATKAGRIIIGTLPYSSLFDSADGTPLWSLADLIRTATCVLPIDKTTSFTLRNAVSDPNIVTFCNANLNENEVTNTIGGEFIVYAVLDSPFANITTGAISNYTMDIRIKCNYAFYPRADAFTRFLGVDDLDRPANPNYPIYGKNDARQVKSRGKYSQLVLGGKDAKSNTQIRKALQSPYAPIAMSFAK
jgi:hypothetical protein